MKPYTTPINRFELEDIDTAVIENVRIFYYQDDEEVLKKEGDDVTIDGALAVVKLTQEETALFAMEKIIEMEIEIITYAGEVLKSNIMTEYAKRVLNKEVYAR